MVERGREKERERIERVEWRPAMTMWRGKSPRGREVRKCGRAESKEGEEEQVAPLIAGAGHTWLLPGRCGVELRQNPNTQGCGRLFRWTAPDIQMV